MRLLGFSYFLSMQMSARLACAWGGLAYKWWNFVTDRFEVWVKKKVFSEVLMWVWVGVR
jgi:hypothetical protein